MIGKILLVFILFFLSTKNTPGGCVPITEYAIFRAERELFYLEVKNKPFTEELLKKAIWYERIQYPKVVFLQSQLETGFYTSDIFNNGHNCFGMKYPKHRQTIAVGTYQGHAQYSHWSDSVRDYKIWQEWYLSLGFKISKKVDDAFYLVFLNCIKYAEDPYYIHKLVKLQSLKDIA